MKLSLSTPMLSLVLAAIPSPHLLAHAQVAPECSSSVPYDYHSGDTSSAIATISHPTTPWIQLDLSDTELAPNAVLLLVGANASQSLDAAALSANGYSSVFDGDSVRVELITPGSVRSGSTSRVVVSSLNIGLCKPLEVAPSICNIIDDRVPSTDERAGRIGGCTGWLISEDVFIQAGHCGAPSSSTRIHFAYGVGSALAIDQYAVDIESYRGVNGGVGNDWGAGRLLPNADTGKLPGVAQEQKCLQAGKPAGCGWYTLGTVPSATSGNNIRITGYGTAEVDSRSQKTHMDSLVTIASTFLSYVPDTTGGNSGSPVIHEETGHAVGVHTHGGCDSGGNSGTRIDKPEFAAHVDFLTMTCSQDSDCFVGEGPGGEFCDSNQRCQFGNAPTSSPTPNTLCDEFPDTERVAIKVLTDGYPGETSWTLFDECLGAEVNSSGSLAANTQYVDQWCMPLHRYTFTINDSYGDGICCDYGDGEYEVIWGGAVEKMGGAFGSTETTTFGAADCSGVTLNPTKSPVTSSPTKSPITASPTKNPTPVPTEAPVTSSPTKSPITASPTKNPTPEPTEAPTTSSPTTSPTTANPTTSPTSSPTASPVTPAPTNPPTAKPTDSPTAALNCGQFTRANTCKFPCQWSGKNKVCSDP